MFGFSLPKIILLLAILFLVWQVFKIIEKRNRLKNNNEDDTESKDETYESLIECKQCGNFFSKDSVKNCPLCNKQNKKNEK